MQVIKGNKTKEEFILFLPTDGIFQKKRDIRPEEWNELCRNGKAEFSPREGHDYSFYLTEEQKKFVLKNGQKYVRNSTETYYLVHSIPGGKGFWCMAYIGKYDAGIICVRNKKSECILAMQEMIEDTQGEEDWVFDVGTSYII